MDPSALKLLKLSSLIQSATVNYITAKSAGENEAEGHLPSHDLFEAQRILLSAAGMLTELVMEPSERIVEVALQQFEARSLHLAAALRIPELLDEYGVSGCDIHEISTKTGIESKKLCMFVQTVRFQNKPQVS